jgi:hypothetical protein
MTKTDHLPAGGPTISGRVVVVSMFVFGMIATGLLYAYWTLHLMPFMPLQEAIVAEFKGSAPRVDGGKRKLHKETPTILRIVMKTEIDPTATDPETLQTIAKMQKRVAELAKEKVQMPTLDFIELHLYQLVKEKVIREKSFRLDLKTEAAWKEIDPRAMSGAPVNDSESPAASESGSQRGTDAVAPSEPLP